MPLDLHNRLRNAIRRYLGTKQALNHISDLEERMATWLTVMNGLVEQSTAASAAQQTSFANLHNGQVRQEQQIAEFKQMLADALAKNGEVTPEMQAKVDEISQTLTDMKNAADTADDGFEPVEEPTDEVPPVEQPTEEQPPVVTEPVEGEPTVPSEGETRRR